MTPQVSIVILNWNHPEVIDICLRRLAMTEGVDYEVVVVDNGSDPDVVSALRKHHQDGLIDTLMTLPENLYFSEGNNVGVRLTDPDSPYILLMNSDVAVMRPDWLVKLLAWMEGTAEYRPTVWGLMPTQPKGGPLDIVSAGWSHDASVEPSHARPEGWCCLFRRSVWRDLNPAHPWHNGFEQATAESVRAGARCGVLFNYALYLVHREGASGGAVGFTETEPPNIASWFAGLDIETLDFTLGPNEHSSYLEW
jgi:glycosyltransferase involved in cell wall biosynthesis